MVQIVGGYRVNKARSGVSGLLQELSVMLLLLLLLLLMLVLSLLLGLLLLLLLLLMMVAVEELHGGQIGVVLRQIGQVYVVVLGV